MGCARARRRGGIGYVGYPVLEARIFKTEVAVTEISTVSPAQAAITVTSTGYVVPQKISRVGAKLPGRVAKVLIKEGSVVKAGDTLVLLEATDQQSSIAVAGARASAAQARVETAQANLADLRQQLERERRSSRRVRSERPQSTTSPPRPSRPSKP